MEFGQLSITSKSRDLWIILPDSINLDDSKAVESAILNNCNSKLKHVVFDFSIVNNLYSSGLGLIVRVRKFVQDRGGVLVIVNVSGRILEIIKALNLDRIIPIYLTDVEYKISHEDVWDRVREAVLAGFIFSARIEDCFYRIILSGEMISSHDLQCIQDFQTIQNIALYIFDLSSLEKVDLHGAHLFQQLTSRITQSGASCRAFGAEELLFETLKLLNADKYVTFFKTEQDALLGNDPV